MEGDAIVERKRDLAGSKAALVGFHLRHAFRDSGRLTDEKKTRHRDERPGFFPNTTISAWR